MRSFDYFELDRRLLQIASPRFDEATRVLAGVSDRRAAWEALVAGELLPASWAAADRRVFASAHEPRRPEQPYPSALDAARIAGAAEVMVAVEEFADRIVAALEPWGQPGPERIVWRLLPPGRLKQRWIRSMYATCEPMHLAALHAINAVNDTTAWSDAAQLSSQRGRNAAQRVFAHDVAMHATWRHAVDVNAVVPPGPLGQVLVPGEGYRPLHAPAALVGRPFALLADPMSPLMAIWEAGCVLTLLTQQRICLSLPTCAGG